VVFFHDKDQEAAALASRDRLAASGTYHGRPIITGILPPATFWPAEECHQQFYEKCAGGYAASRQIYE
jgi:peptide methionine sulfoxide reductase MsrA